jgi:hypothetical protein
MPNFVEEHITHSKTVLLIIDGASHFFQYSEESHQIIET